MKTTYGWYAAGGNGTDSSGFSGLPGGSRDYNGGFNGAGGSGKWWSFSPLGSNAWVRGLFGTNDYILRFDSSPPHGFSVRCVRDAE